VCLWSISIQNLTHLAQILRLLPPADEMLNITWGFWTLSTCSHPTCISLRFSYVRMGRSCDLFPSHIMTKFCMHFWCPPYVLHVSPTFSLMQSPCTLNWHHSLLLRCSLGIFIIFILFLKLVLLFVLKQIYLICKNGIKRQNNGVTSVTSSSCRVSWK
jgi:hypothetical protein